MTPSTKHRVVCDCGHFGFILATEYPVSNPLLRWKHYTLLGLEGASSFAGDVEATWERIFLALKPRCPQCGLALMPSNLWETP